MQDGCFKGGCSSKVKLRLLWSVSALRRNALAAQGWRRAAPELRDDITSKVLKIFT